MRKRVEKKEKERNMRTSRRNKRKGRGEEKSSVKETKQRRVNINSIVHTTYLATLCS